MLHSATVGRKLLLPLNNISKTNFKPMLISRCCKHQVYATLNHYYCGLCHIGCDAIDSSLIAKDCNNDHQRPAISPPIDNETRVIS